MKFSELWLRELVTISLNSEELSNQITMAGLKVEKILPVANSFKGVIIGEIIHCEKHPKINKLKITKINIGSERLLDVICEASNCRKWLKVVVATANAILADNFKIKKLKIFNEQSEGTLLSFSDLGIVYNEDYNKSDELIELPKNAPIGTDIREYLKLNDNIIEVNITPNRSDCLSVIGLARDLSVLNQTKLSIPEILPVLPTIKDTLPIKVDVPEACPRYLGRIIKGINIKTTTPIWMKEKLRRSGFQPINIVVDITNYILVELGQPIQILDKDRIESEIVVRMAKVNEEILLLDNTKKKLSKDTIVISDKHKILAIGGIYGSKYSSVNNQTENIFLECALFNPLTIAKCVQLYSLHTDASHRYKNGVDPELQYKAIERATSLLINLCNSGESGPLIDITNKFYLPKRTSILLRRDRLDHLIGYHIKDITVSNILRLLGCEVIEDSNKWHVLAPSWRFDINIEEDLIEEIVRVYGYDRIRSTPLQISMEIGNYSESILPLNRVKTMLHDKGYQEVITYSFVDPILQQLIHPNKKSLILLNPISRDMSVMRLSLWTGLLKTILYNQNRQQDYMRIFEVGLRFVPDKLADLGIRQDLMIAGAISGKRHKEHWDLDKKNADFYDMKGDLESILELTGKLLEIKFVAEDIPSLHPGQSASIYLNNDLLGFIGAVHPQLERKLNLNYCTLLFELEWNKIANRTIPQVYKISKFPANRRDIAIIVDKKIPAADILAECKKVNLDQIVNVNLFDVYCGEGVAKGYKSLAISLILQDANYTLKEEEINATTFKCIKVLQDKFQASLR